VIEDELIKLISKLTALDQKWLIRIILKDLRLGLGQSRIFSTYHPLAKDFYARQAHLSSVCQSVESGETLPDDRTALEVCPFQPVRPMLCQRINFQLIEPLIADKVFYLETKFDGEYFVDS
jgi:DNA ligase 4